MGDYYFDIEDIADMLNYSRALCGVDKITFTTIGNELHLIAVKQTKYSGDMISCHPVRELIEEYKKWQKEWQD